MDELPDHEKPKKDLRLKMIFNKRTNGFKKIASRSFALGFKYEVK